MVRSQQRRAAVLGSPIAHSLSPVLHRAAYRQLGLDWSYDAVEVDSDALPGFLESCDASWVGLSLTMPLKEAVLSLLDEASDLVGLTHSANTVLFENGRRRGENTDVEGIRWALATAGAGLEDGLDSMGVSVIGAGATARSAIAALAGMGAELIAVVARRAAAIDDLAAVAAGCGVRVAPIPWDRVTDALTADVVVSTVPIGASDYLAQRVPTQTATMLDVVYAPWPTPLAGAWQRGGGTAVGGLAMLVGQAAVQVELMTGLAAPIEVMRAAGLAALGS
ncbi:MAG: shikimate dehydrogenase [Actinomycetes bacterium]